MAGSLDSMIIEEVNGILSSFAVDAAALISQWSDIRLTFSQTEFYTAIRQMRAAICIPKHYGGARG